MLSLLAVAVDRTFQISTSQLFLFFDLTFSLFHLTFGLTAHALLFVHCATFKNDLGSTPKILNTPVENLGSFEKTVRL